MLNRVRGLRRHLATELGFIVPPVHITDNLRLKPREYVVSLRGIEIGRWQTEQNCVLAVNGDPKARPLPGTVTQEPAFGVAARWIAPGLEEQALAAGYSVVDQTTVIATHIGELIRRNAQELLSRHEVKRLLDTMNESHPKLVEELVPKLMTLGEVQKVLQQLLREQVSIRDLGAILEVLVEAAQHSKSTVHLVEAVRQALGRALVHPLLDAEGGLRVLVLATALEQEIVGTFDPESASRLLGDGTRPAPAAFLRRIVESVKRLTGGGPNHGPSRAPDSKSGALSPAAMAGAIPAGSDGVVAGGDSAGGAGAERLGTHRVAERIRRAAEGVNGWRSTWSRTRSTRCLRAAREAGGDRSRPRPLRSSRSRSARASRTTSAARARSAMSRCRRSARSTTCSRAT